MSGRPRKYNKKTLKDAIEHYFSSISRTAEAMCGSEPVFNDFGDTIKYTQYIIPPSVSALCLFLGIDRSTWENYCDSSLHPEFEDVTSFAKMKMEEYLERELNTREKNVQGIIFNLQNNYGWRDKKELELGDRAAKSVMNAMTIAEKADLLRTAARDFERNVSRNMTDE